MIDQGLLKLPGHWNFEDCDTTVNEKKIQLDVNPVKTRIVYKGSKF